MSTPATIRFVTRRPPPQPGAVCVDLHAQPQPGTGIETLTADELLARWSGDAVEWFAGWLGQLNARHAALDWWAYSSTSKNFLSSALGARTLQLLALRNLARSGRYRLIVVLGATPGQMRSGARLLQPEFTVTLPSTLGLGLRNLAAHALAIGRVIYQAVRIRGAFRFGTVPPETRRDVILFTYLDGEFSAGWDRYFGDLADLIRQQQPELRTACVAYVYTPYRQRLDEMLARATEPYLPLYGFLDNGELLRALGRSIAATFGLNKYSAGMDVEAAAMASLLEEALIEDVSRRGYLHNLLVHHATAAMVRTLSPSRVIYPYENKSLEKALLLGARAAGGVRLVGYQHTSITPRHIGLRFEAGETATTPLPDRIVTVGSITRDYLEESGNYPAGRLVAGCALRQAWTAPLPSRPLAAGHPRILLALSSSIRELVSAVEFMREVKTRLPGVEIGVRPHLNFPLTILSPELRDWVRTHATDFSGSLLQDNLAWADVTAYVSSTVALESLMLGRPVIYLAIDPDTPDPLLGNPRFR
ncbi:MAG: hypothetical protein Q8L65_14715, partial [Burkholderiales bacterium]|nr:hypothetical protein [Burkholderiales bacterium]